MAFVSCSSSSVAAQYELRVMPRATVCSTVPRRYYHISSGCRRNVYRRFALYCCLRSAISLPKTLNILGVYYGQEDWSRLITLLTQFLVWTSHNLTNFKCFLSLSNIYHWFVPKLSCFAAVLNKKLQTRDPRTFNTFTKMEHDAAEALQDRLISAPVLALTRSDGHVIFDMDACDKQ